MNRWIEVSEDTLLIRRIGPFAKIITRRLVQHPKLFMFDVGVLIGLIGNFVASSDRIGALFETLVAAQLNDSAASLAEDIRVTTLSNGAAALGRSRPNPAANQAVCQPQVP